MPYRLTPFVNESYYHVFNRGVEKRQIFSSKKDYDRFLQTLYYYQFSGPKSKFSNYKRFRFKEFFNNPRIIEIICYCLMPNHFHLLLKQIKDNGIQEFIAKLSNSYTKYFNTKNYRIGPLLQGQFKAIIIESDEQLLHLSRYIHLNPYVSGLVEEPESYEYSSYKDFLNLKNNSLCFRQPVLDFFKRPQAYKSFITDFKDYAKELHTIKHLLLEET